ncbi:hypothetical protein BLA29_005749, partial [Euroglyphus maynei]
QQQLLSFQQLQQHPADQQQFVQPLDKPRPFLVMKPGFRNSQKLLHQIQIEHQQQQPLTHSSQTLPQHQPQAAGLSSSLQSTSELENPFMRFNSLNNGQHLLRAPNQAVQLQAQTPSSTPALFQHFSAQLPLGQPVFRPIQSFSRLSTGGSQQQLGQAHSSFLRSATQGQTFPQLTSTGGFLSQPPSSTSSTQQPVQPSSFLTSNAVSQSMPQTFQGAKKQTVQVETVEGPPSSTIDTRAELQNQIKHILASSPNLSEDSRVRHREAIFKAVHSLIEPTDSSSSNHQQQQQQLLLQQQQQQQLQHQHQSTNTLQSSSLDSSTGRFEPFHPKSMLFNFPVSQTSQRSNSASRLPSTLSSGSSSAQLQQANVRRPSQIQPDQFTLSPIQPLGKLPFNLLARFPSLLPGLQQPMLSSPADTGKQDQSNDQKIQTQIQTFLQQNDPQRL